MEEKQLQQLAEDLRELNLQVNDFIENTATVFKDLQTLKHKLTHHIVVMVQELPPVQDETPAPDPEQPSALPAQD